MAYLESFEENKKYGYKDNSGNIVVVPLYDSAPYSFGLESPSKCRYANVCINDKWGVIDESGRIIVPIQYKEARPLINDLFAVLKCDKSTNYNYKYGAIDVGGNTIIPFNYKLIHVNGGYIECFKDANYSTSSHYEKRCGWAYRYSSEKNADWYNSLAQKFYEGDAIRVEHGFLIVEEKGKLGLVNQYGKQTLPCKYNEIKCVNQHRIIVWTIIENDWRFGVLDDSANIIIPFKYKYIDSESGYFFNCYTDCDREFDSDNHSDSLKYINKSGQVWFNKDGIILHNGMGKVLNDESLAIESNGLWGVCDQNKKRVVNFAFDEVSSVQDKIVVQKDGKIGILNSNGEVIISPSYQSIECVAINNNVIGSPYFYHYMEWGHYTSSHSFDTEKPAKSLIRKRVYCINNDKGNRIEVENPNEFKWNNFFILSTEDYAELFTIKDGIIASSRAEKVFQITNDIYIIKRSSKWGVFNANDNELIIPCDYDRIQYYGGHVILLCKDSLWGVKSIEPSSNSISDKNDVEIPVQYKEIKILDSDQLYYGVMKCDEGVENKYTIVLNDGEKYSEISDLIDTDSQFKMFTNDRILSSRNGKWGFVSLLGYDSIPFKYDSIEERQDGQFDVMIEGKCGVLNLDGREVVAVKYANRIPLNYENEIVQDQISKHYGTLSKDGSEKIPTIYEHLFHCQNDNYFFYGYGGEPYPNFFSAFDSAKWGCMDYDGKQIIPAKYECFKVTEKFILAGREGYILGSDEDAYSGIYDLYTKNGELIFGGFHQFEEINNHYLFSLNWNDNWLALDKNLLSVNLGSEGNKIQFHKGFVVSIINNKKDEETRFVCDEEVVETEEIINTQHNNFDSFLHLNKRPQIVDDFIMFDEGEAETEEIISTRHYNIDNSLLLIEKPQFIGEYMITTERGLSRAIRLSDGEPSKYHNEIYPINEKLLLARDKNKVGIVSFEDSSILPMDYFAFTYPVNNYLFAFKDGQDSNCSVDLIVIMDSKISILNAIASKPREDIIELILNGSFIITLKPSENGLKSISVYQPTIFDDGFASEINNKSEGFLCYPFETIYWFSNDSALIEPKHQYYQDDYRENYRDDDFDYERETWDAMTDGMYGDYPGSGIDYDTIGFGI